MKYSETHIITIMHHHHHLGVVNEWYTRVGGNGIDSEQVSLSVPQLVPTSNVTPPPTNAEYLKHSRPNVSSIRIKVYSGWGQNYSMCPEPYTAAPNNSNSKRVHRGQHLLIFACAIPHIQILKKDSNSSEECNIQFEHRELQCNTGTIVQAQRIVVRGSTTKHWNVTAQT